MFGCAEFPGSHRYDDFDEPSYWPRCSHSTLWVDTAASINGSPHSRGAVNIPRGVSTIAIGGASAAFQGMHTVAAKAPVVIAGREQRSQE